MKKKKSNRFYTSRSTLIEFASAIMRLKREGKFDLAEANQYIDSFITETQQFLIFIAQNLVIEKKAIDLLTKYNLRAADALQLACAIDAQSIFEQKLYFVSDDNRLCDTAMSEGFTILKPSESNSTELVKNLLEET